jgi:hypothetical protein
LSLVAIKLFGVASEDSVVVGASEGDGLVEVSGAAGSGTEGFGVCGGCGSGALLGSERGLGCLWVYTHECGVARPPAAYVTGDGFRLGRWVVSRRAARGKDPVLDALLESLPGWTWSTRDLFFEERVRQFVAARDSGGLKGDRGLRDWAVCQWRAAATGELSMRKLEQLKGAVSWRLGQPTARCEIA